MAVYFAAPKAESHLSQELPIFPLGVPEHGVNLDYKNLVYNKISPQKKMSAYKNPSKTINVEARFGS